jgi:hypothetical protein
MAGPERWAIDGKLCIATQLSRRGSRSRGPMFMCESQLVSLGLNWSRSGGCCYRERLGLADQREGRRLGDFQVSWWTSGVASPALSSRVDLSRCGDSISGMLDKRRRIQYAKASRDGNVQW